MSESLYILWHGGLGDALICNSLVRHFAKDFNVFVPVKHRNVPSVNFQFRDDPRIQIIPVDDDQQARDIAEGRDKHKLKTLRLGLHGEGFDIDHWDTDLYRMAGLRPELRWEGFHVVRDPHREVKTLDYPYVFVHDDRTRCFFIDPEKLPDIPAVFAHKSATIFDWCAVIENATEIHCIDSAFLSLVDLMSKVNAKRLVFHKYARPGGREPTKLRRHWEILE